MATSTPAPVVTDDPGTTAKIYTNGGGVISQATSLKSTDGRAIVSLSEGIVTKDAGGKPLSEMTIRAVPSGNLPAVPAGSAFTFAGMAYEIGPDGATFSPPVTLALTLPQAQWGKDYSVKSFDRTSGTWQDQPSAFDAATGTITVQVSHLSIFALFMEPRVSPVTTPAGTPQLTVAATPQVTAKPPTTAMSIFTNMIGWVVSMVMNNIIILVIIIVLAIGAVFFYRKGKFPGSGR